LGLLSFMITISVMSPTLPAQPVDGIVVFTGGADRVQAGLDLLKHKHGHELLISGVNKGTRLPDLLRETKQNPADFPCCITLGFAATDTVGNAHETADWAHTHKVQSLLVVTSNYHMPRALIEMRRALPTAQVSPYPVVSSRFQILTPKGLRLTLREYQKTIFALLRLSVAETRRVMGQDQP
jgi:uncharacterized SAM-binding protein YcdF (DUF218 family)